MPIQLDHSRCDHLSTTGARAACRRRGGGDKVQVKERRDWKNEIIPRAAEIVESYDTNVTLRQLFYRLVAEQLIQNTKSDYGHLGRETAELRDEDEFPDLVDQTRQIHGDIGPAEPEIMDLKRHVTPQKPVLPWGGPSRSGAEGQPYNILLGVEKDTMTAQLTRWFPDLPVIPLGGQTSQPLRKMVTEAIQEAEDNDDERETVLIYAGDFDPSGLAIMDSFIRKTGCWDKHRRIAVKQNHIEEYGLPVGFAKPGDPNTKKFRARFPKTHRRYSPDGRAIQVELEALPPEVIREMYQEAINEFWDETIAEQVKARREQDQARVRQAAAKIQPLVDELWQQVDEWDWEELLR